MRTTGMMLKGDGESVWREYCKCNFTYHELHIADIESNQKIHGEMSANEHVFFCEEG